MQNDHGFKTYQLQKKSIFQQLIAKIPNFANFRQNNIVFALKKGKKKAFINYLSLEKMNFTDFGRNNSVFMQKMFIVQQLISNFADFL